MAHPPVPQHPFLSPNGTSSMHNDAYSTDAYDVSGPLGRDLSVTSRSYGVRECATITFDSEGRIVALCGGLEGFTMMLIHPETLEPISELTMPGRDATSGRNPLTDICGGTYFFLDDRDRAFATDHRPARSGRCGRRRTATSRRSGPGRSPDTSARMTAWSPWRPTGRVASGSSASTG